MGSELDKRQHVGAMSGSFAPLPDGDPNFLCRSVAHSIQENVVYDQPRETQNRRERLSGSRGGTNRAQQLTHFLDALKRYGA